MASNGLVANPSKTALLFINNKVKGDPIKIKIGNVEITQEKSAKLLGMTMDDNQSWVTWEKRCDFISESKTFHPQKNEELSQVTRSQEDCR